MSKVNNGGYAFPSGLANTESGIISSDDVGDGGMNLRDYFAAKAMQGIYSNPEIWPMYDQVAKMAYGLADAMLAERET
ncbi:MAG TPA: hypothetical protein DD666_00640 [Advenella kashmirensis]|uniref:Uncharacterized protein n=1 Tax=Advenella kashmirensis TaxID=310575 RepID=A0A356LA73_9BURK|nr:hypothetical protein [Advenella kashmirensis]